MSKIDLLDKKILNIVTKNARIPSKDVALECGVSRAAIHQRLQRLQELRIITGSAYIVDPESLGYTICAFIGLKIDAGIEAKDIAVALEAIPEVVGCHFTTGPYSLLIKMYAKGKRHLLELLNDKIQRIPGIADKETMLSLEQTLDRQIEINTDE